MSEFQPDWRNFAAVMQNRRPARLPLYEHFVNTPVMERYFGVQFGGLDGGGPADQAEFFRYYCRFFRELTYDTVSYEICLGGALVGPSALCGGQGPIQSRADFAAYPWRELPSRYWALARPRFDALAAVLPEGMKVVGGIGNGVFELAESLVGLEHLPYLQADDPELYADLFRAIGDLMVAVWREFLPRYSKHFVACRFGDDLGFKSSLLTNPVTVREHIMPQYRRVIALVHESGGRFLWHSCGCIFEIMEDAIAAGIDAKHSNEDAIAPFDRWIAEYGSRIGLVGGFDLNLLCAGPPETVYQQVLTEGRRFRRLTPGYALGSGNSIPEYVPQENFLAMIRAAQDLRREEGNG